MDAGEIFTKKMRLELSYTGQVFFFFSLGEEVEIFEGVWYMWGKSEEICLSGMVGVWERIVRNKVGEESEARCLITINQY